MKNIISLLLISFCCISSIFSQIEFGIIAGPNYSNVRFIQNGSFTFEDGDQNQDYLLGIHAGLLMNVRFDDHFSVESNILYHQKGYNFTDQFLSESGKVLLHNITVPIMVGYQIFPKATVQLGPEIGYLVSSRLKILDTNQDFSGVYDKNLNLSGLAGINYAFTDHLELGIRYLHGITRMNQETVTTVTDNQGTALGTVDVKAKSRVFQLSMRYKI